MMPDTTFVFISGAGLQDYIWDNVIKELDVLSIAIKYNDKLHSLNEYVDSAMNQIDNSRARKIVIVAHSAGGVIAVEVAKRLGNKFAGFIAISAVIPVPSQSFVSSLPFPQKFIMPIILKIAGATPPESSIRNNLAKDLSIQNQDKIVKITELRA